MNPANVSSKRIELTTELDFGLGRLLISPSTCRVHGKDGEIRIEPRVMEVLVTLWRSAGRTVTRDQLVDCCWAGRAVSEDAVARVIAKLRQLARIGGETHFVVETIPKLGFRLVPTAAIEPSQHDGGEAQVTSDLGAAAEPPAGSLGGFVDFSQLNRRTKWVATGWALTSVAAVTLLVVWLRGLTPSTSIPIQSGQVALTPFAVTEPDAISGLLAQEIREQVTQFLAEAGLPPVETSPRRGTTPGSTRTEFEVGGSIRSEGGDYVVNAWIRDFTSGGRLWSSRLSRGAKDFAGLDEEVGDAVATTLRCALDQRKGAPHPLDARQLSLFLSACSAVAARGPDALETTGRLVQAAPSVPGAQALRAFALADYASNIDNFDNETRAAEARGAAARAIALNPNTALAHLALGLLSDSKRGFAERERNLLRALELDPNLTRARVQYVMLLREVGRVRAAKDIAFRIEDSRDHSVRGALGQLILLQAQSGERAATQRLMKRLDRVSPGEASVRWTAAVWWQDPSQIPAEVWQLGFQSTPTNGVVCFQEYLRKLVGAAGKPLHGLPAECAVFEVDWRVRMLAREGDLDGAYELVEQDLPVSRATMFLFYPEMKAFRGDPRFRPLAERLRLLAYWRETHLWPDSCSDEQSDWCQH